MIELKGEPDPALMDWEAAAALIGLTLAVALILWLCWRVRR